MADGSFRLLESGDRVAVSVVAAPLGPWVGLAVASTREAAAALTPTEAVELAGALVAAAAQADPGPTIVDTFRARLDDHCPGCNSPIVPGQQIAVLSDNTYRHALVNCLPESARHG